MTKKGIRKKALEYLVWRWTYDAFGQRQPIDVQIGPTPNGPWRPYTNEEAHRRGQYVTNYGLLIIE